MNVWFFKVGAMALIFSLGLYTEAHLRNGDPEIEATSERAALVFWIIIIGVAFSSFVGFEVMQLVFPSPPSWRELHRSQRRSRKSPMQPVSGMSSIYFCNKQGFRPGIQLEVITISEMRDNAMVLFDLVDLDGNGVVDLGEICNVIGFTLPSIPNADAGSYHSHQDSHSPVEPPVFDRERSSFSAPGQEEERKAKEAHRLLKGYPVLQVTTPGYPFLVLRFLNIPQYLQNKCLNNPVCLNGSSGGRVAAAGRPCPEFEPI